MRRRLFLAGGLALACGVRPGAAVSRSTVPTAPVRRRALRQDVLSDIEFVRSELQLPEVRNGEDPTYAPGAVALARGLWIDGMALEEDSGSWLAGVAPKPLVEFTRVLVNKRLLWRQLNPQAPAFPGVFQLWVDARVPVRGVKSLVLSATAAGYPNLSFMAWNSAAPSEIGRLFFDGRVAPGWNRRPRNEPELLVEVVSSTAVVLTWRVSGEPLANPREMSVAELWRNAEPEWRSRGSHFTPSDLRVDRAVLAVPDSIPFGALFPILDALATPKRGFTYEGRDETFPAFEVTFAVAESELPQYLEKIPSSVSYSR